MTIKTCIILFYCYIMFVRLTYGDGSEVKTVIFEDDDEIIAELVLLAKNTENTQEICESGDQISNCISETDTGTSGGENTVVGKYKPTWDSLDSRPLPQWYDEAKIGIFIHWGVFSVPSFQSEWFWYRWKSYAVDILAFMLENYSPRFTYQDFGRQFTTEFFDPYEWADVFQKSGAKYIVLTSKHHEGYTMWPSKYSFGWNSMDVGPKRDLVGELAQAVREKTDVKFGIYHSMFEWFNPLWISDKDSGFEKDELVRFKVMPELKEVVETYKPEIIWSDGEWEASENYWKSRDFLAWLYNDSPVSETVVTNDRWGNETRCKHGDFYTCSDHYSPGTLQSHKWENCMTLDRKSWGYRRNARVKDYLKPEELVSEVVKTISCGGNILINIGPTKEGTLPPIMEERLLQLGQWLEVNGEAIYKSVPWNVTQNDKINKNIWYTENTAQHKVYAIIVGFPGSQVQLGSVDKSKVKGNIEILGSTGMSLQWKPASEGIIVSMPRQEENKSQWAWTLVFSLKTI